MRSTSWARYGRAVPWIPARVLLQPVPLLLLLGCGGGERVGFEREDEHLSTYLATSIPVRGTVLGDNGRPVAGATVTLGSAATTTGGDGVFSLLPSKRANLLLAVSASGYRDEQIPVVTLIDERETALSLDPILLSPSSPSTVRMLFGGDTAFGRRWLNPSEDIPRDVFPPDDPQALIRSSDPGPGTAAALQWIRPHFREADWSVVNLETPITRSVLTPHPTKEYCFFSLPGSLPVLKDLGVSYVSLGNNHVYDYLEQGLQDTIDHLNGLGIHWSGAGRNAAAAFVPYTTTLKGTTYAFFSAGSISGAEDGFLPAYTAGPDKGGCADLKDVASVQNTIATHAATAAVIAQLHFGFEYALAPSTNGRGYVQAAVDAGARLVVSNHSHVAQGVGFINQVPVLYCLGNLALDQDRLETFLGALARVDMSGADVQAIRMIPIYLEDYRPRLVNGFLADYLVRRQAEFSDANVRVFPYLGQAWVALSPAAARAASRTVEQTITVPSSGEAMVDLRDLKTSAGASLAEVSGDVRLTFQPGRDILVYGDFEDWDTDEDRLEASRWDLNDSQRVCLEAAWRGAVGLRLKRGSYDTQDAVTAFRARVRVEGDNVNRPNKDLSLVGKVRGTNAGPVRVVARWFASKGERQFGEASAFTRRAGTYDWETFAVPLDMPADSAAGNPRYETEEPHALRLFIRHSPGAARECIADFDDLAVVSWQDTQPVAGALSLRTPHALDFVRVRGPAGTHTLRLTFQSHRPAVLP